MKKTFYLKAAAVGSWLLALPLITIRTALAAAGGGGGLPWEAPITAVVDSLSGPVAFSAAILMFVVGGIMWGLTRHEEGARRFAQAIFGAAIALSAVTILTTLGFGGAVV